MLALVTGHAPKTGRNGAARPGSQHVFAGERPAAEIRSRQIQSRTPKRSTSTTTKNVKWVAKLGSQSYGNVDGRERQGVRRHEQRYHRAIRNIKGDRSILMVLRRKDRRISLAA